jgi:hypothetical protein
MKSITIDISDQAYNKFRELLEKLPKGSFKILDDDPDILTAEEKKVFYSIQDKIDKGDFSDFEDWDNLKESI